MVDTRTTSILFVLPWPVEGIGGVTRVVRNLILKTTEAERYSPTLAICNYPDIVGKRRSGEICEEFWIRLPARIPTRRSVYSWFKSGVQLTLFVVQMAFYVRRKRIRIINIHYPSLNSDCFVILKKFLPWQVKLILSFHGSDVESMCQSSTVDAKRWERLLSGVNHVVVPSRFLAEEVAGLHFAANIHPKVKVIDNGIDCDRTMSEVRQSSGKLMTTLPDEYIVNIGNYVPVKDHETLLRAFFQVAKLVSSLDLVVIGRRDTEFEHLKEMVDKNRFSNRIALLENVSHHDTMALLSRARMFVLSSRREGSPLVLLEAALLGVPVISTAVGGVPELISNEENGLLVEPGNIEQLRDAIARYVTDKQFAALLADNLRTKVTTYRSLTANYEGYEKLFAG